MAYMQAAMRCNANSRSLPSLTYGCSSRAGWKPISGILPVFLELGIRRELTAPPYGGFALLQQLAGKPTKMTSLSVIVTGGASGIGLAMSRHFASLGYQVAILDVNAKSGLEAAKELSEEYPAATVVFKKCDVVSWEEQAAVFKEVFHEHGGKLDVVMANAGIAEGGSVTVVDLEEEEPSPPRLTTLNINLIGVIYCEFS